MKWIKLITGEEISSKPMHLGKTYAEAKALLKENEYIADYLLLQDLRNCGKYPDSFTKFWVFVPNPDKISEKSGFVARFSADSSRVCLVCYWDPLDAGPELGVFVVRKKVKGAKK